jgi:hyperosmotically inducible periplasmic protein
MSAIIGRAVRASAGLAVAAVVFVAPVFADDSALRERIEGRMSKTGLAERGQIEVSVTSGAAVLSGFTTTVEARSQAEKAARKETKDVDNRLQVVPVPRSDEEIRDAVSDAVLGYVYYGVFDSVGVGVQDGMVTLQGSVLQPWRKDELERRVARLEGVRAVQDQIRVQPASPFDDRLRRQLYARIYGNGLFERFANLSNPPVHIVVENGNITLTGLVNSRVEKVVLESIARETLAFRVDNQVQIESEIGKEPAPKS